jgi:hypothetical protein
MTTSGGVGTTLRSANSSTFPDVLYTPASLIGSELSVYLAPASIMPLAAPFDLSGAAFSFAPLMRCAGASVVRTYLSPVGRAHHANLYLQHLRARTSASIMGSELQPPALRSTPPDALSPLPTAPPYAVWPLVSADTSLKPDA